LTKEKLKSSFAWKLFKIFAIPFLLFFLMGRYVDDLATTMMIGFSIYAYFIIGGFIMVLRFFIKAIKFIFFLKKINIFWEEKNFSNSIILGRVIGVKGKLKDNKG